MPEVARIALAERWSVLRRGLAGVLQQHHRVVAEVDDASELVTIVGVGSIDLLILGDDGEIDLCASVEALHHASTGDTTPPVMVLADDLDADQVRAIMQAGASAVFSKKVADETLVDTVQRLLDGDRVIDQHYLPLLYRDAGQPAAEEPAVQSERLAGLTRREAEVLAELARGGTNREIADALTVGEATVKTHLIHIYEKLGVTDRHHAVGRALELGILQ